MEGLRGYGVLAILLAHVSTEFLGKNRGHLNLLGVNWIDWPTSYFRFWEEGNPVQFFDVFLVWTAKTHYCVDLFFVVSGFLIFRILCRDQRNFSYPKFMWNRITRVYPAFLFSLAFAIYVRTVFVGEIPFEWPAFLKNLVFLNDVRHPGWSWVPHWQKFPNYNPVAWTLFFEFIFYAFIPLTLFIPGLRITKSRLTYLAFSLVLFAAFYLLHPGQYHIRWLFFLAGGFVGIHSTSQLNAFTQKVPDWVALALYLASTLYYAFTPYDYRVFAPFYMITGTLFMVNVGYGGGFLSRMFSHPILRYVGNCSYSLYLIHLMCIRAVWKIYRNIEDWPNGISGPGFWPWLALLVGSLALGLTLATLLFVFVEKRYFAAKMRAKEIPPGAGGSTSGRPA